LALPLPTLMISEILGVPYEKHEFVQHNAHVGAGRNATIEQSMQAYGALSQLLSELIEQRMAEPRDDVISDLAQRVADGEVTVHEAANMGLGLLSAGHE